MIHTVQTLLPVHESVINDPGDDMDFALYLEDVQKLTPAVLQNMTKWLERQITDTITLATAQAG